MKKKKSKSQHSPFDRIFQNYPWILAFLFPVISLALYASTLDYPLVYDSVGKIDLTFFYNDYIASFSPLKTRWVFFVNLWLDHLVFKGDFSWFRLENILWHGLNSSIIYLFLKSLFNHLIPTDIKIKLTPIPLLAFLAALLFCLNPVSVYATVNIIQRSILLATFFSILCCWIFFVGLTKNKTWLLYISTLFYFLAIHSKEHAILISVLLVIFVYITNSFRKEHIKKWLPPLILVAFMAIQVVFFSSGIIGQIYEPKTTAIIPHITRPEQAPSLWILSIINQSTLFFHYLWLWIFPLPKLMAIDMATVFPSQLLSLHSLGFLGYLLFLGFAAYSLCKKHIWTLLGLGLLCPGILFITEFTVVRYHDTFILYRSYLWMFGFYIILPFFLQWVSKKQQVALLAMLAFIFTWVSLDRMQTFQSSIALWADAADKIDYSKKEKLSLNAYRPFASVGGHMAQKGEHEKAIQYYRKAIDVNPHVFNLYNSIGVSLSLNGQKEEAALMLLKAIELNPEHPMAYYNLGSLYYEKGDVNKAGLYFTKTLMKKVDHDGAHYQLAKVFFAKQDFKKAETHYRLSLKHNPNQPKAMEQLAQVLANQRRFEEALQILIGALFKSPQSKSIRDTMIKIKDEINRLKNENK